MVLPFSVHQCCSRVPVFASLEILGRRMIFHKNPHAFASVCTIDFVAVACEHVTRGADASSIGKSPRLPFRGGHGGVRKGHRCDPETRARVPERGGGHREVKLSECITSSWCCCCYCCCRYCCCCCLPLTAVTVTFVVAVVVVAIFTLRLQYCDRPYALLFLLDLMIHKQMTTFFAGGCNL